MYAGKHKMKLRVNKIRIGGAVLKFILCVHAAMLVLSTTLSKLRIILKKSRACTPFEYEIDFIKVL